MNPASFPISFRWMIPIIEELVEQHHRDVGEPTLSDEHRAAFDRQFTVEVRRDVEHWLDITRSKEASAFLTGMIVLDELGLLEPTESTLNYEFWRSRLAAPSWGKVRVAAQTIATDYLADLSDEERSGLNDYVAKILKAVINTNTRIWLTWLRCQIDINLDIGRDFLRAIVDRAPENDDEEFDLGEDACCALVSMPYVSKEDIDSVMRFILRADIDEFMAAVALGALLRSAHVTADVKRHAKDLARQTNRSELIDVVETTQGTSVRPSGAKTPPRDKE